MFKHFFHQIFRNFMFLLCVAKIANDFDEQGQSALGLNDFVTVPVALCGKYGRVMLVVSKEFYGRLSRNTVEVVKIGSL